MSAAIENQAVVHAPENFSTCCSRVDPCMAKCMIEQALIDRVAKKTVRRYEVGGQQFELALPSITDLRALLAEYETKCKTSRGERTRGFGRFSTPACRSRRVGLPPLVCK